MVTSSQIRTASHLATPALVLVGTLILFQTPLFSRVMQTLRETAPLLALGLSALLGLRFNRSRVVVAATLLVLVDWTLRGGFSFEVTQHVALTLSALLPLYIAVFAMLPERGLLNLSATIRMGLTLAPGALVLTLAQLQNGTLARVLSLEVVNPDLLPLTRLSQLTLLAFLLAGLIVLLRLIRHGSVLDSGFLGVLLAAGLALEAPDTLASAVYLTAGGLVLTAAVVQESYSLAYLDELTRLPSRRALNEELHKLPRRYAVAMVDVDHFKRFNDRYGHQVGDQVLRFLSTRLRRVGGRGKPFRYGGEEFTILFPGRSVKDVLERLDQLRETISQAQLTLRGPNRPKRKPKKKRKPRSAGNQQVGVSVSIGVAESTRELRNPTDVLERADKALYRAKRKGRNQVCK